MAMLVVIAWSWPNLGRTAERYAAWLADGHRISAPRLTSWHTPTIGNDQLRLIRDRQAKVELKPPYLLLANGDVLTGSPAQMEPDQGRQGIPPRVRVQLEGMLPLSGTGVAVRTDRIARLVGSAEASLRQESPPGTVQLADGRRLIGRSIKWRASGLAVLTAEGIIEANYADIVDAVFPDVDVAAAVLDDNLFAGSAASSASSSSIVRFQLTSGATITASRIMYDRDRFTRVQERTRRRRRNEEPTTYYFAQPAWADRPLALPEKDIAWCGYRESDEAPLSLLPAELMQSQRLVGGGPIWERCAGSEGDLAASGSWEADLGLRTHSHSELAFALPPEARSLETAVGLDRAVGAGGCVRCRIVADQPDGKVLWDSGILQGSDEPKPTGPLDVTLCQRVILVTQFAHDDRPAGADPLDIRDQVVWLAPLVTVEFEPARQLIGLLAGAGDWELAGNGLDQMPPAREWSEFAATWDPLLVLPAATELKLTRRVSVSRANDVVELRTAFPLDFEEQAFQLRVNGQLVAASASADTAVFERWIRNVTERMRYEGATYLSDELAFWWDLQAWRGQEITLELTLRGARTPSEIVWRGLSLRSAVSNLPASGQPLACDVPLVSLTPFDVVAPSRGKPLRNGVPLDGKPVPFRFLGQRFSGGYGMLRDSAISFEITPQYRRFVAVAGCSLFVAGPMQVLIDGKVVWERPLMLGLDPAEQIDLAIPAGAKKLTLQTGPESSYTGMAAWAEAGFVTK